jgi:hypothetical protein
MPTRKRLSKQSCKSAIKSAIQDNMMEYKAGRYVSPQQAIAVSYSQVLKAKPHCKKSLRRSTRKIKRSTKRSSRKIRRSVRKSVRKSRRAIRRSIRKSVRKVKKSVGKSVRKTRARRSSKQVRRSPKKLSYKMDTPKNHGKILNYL